MGTLAGVLIGITLGVLVDTTGSSTFLAAQDSIFLIVGGMTAALMLFVHFRVEEAQREKSKESGAGLVELRRMFKRSVGAFTSNRQLIAMLSSSAVAAAGYISFEKFWQIQVNELSNEPISRAVFYWFFCGGLVVSMLGQQLSVKLSDYFEDNLVYPIIGARVALVLSFACLYLSFDVTTFACSYALIFLFTSSSSAPSSALFHRYAADEVRTSLLSIRSISVQAGATLGIVQAGLIAHYYSVEAAFLASACLYVTSTLIYCSSMERYKRRLLGLDNKALLARFRALQATRWY